MQSLSIISQHIAAIYSGGAYAGGSSWTPANIIFTTGMWISISDLTSLRQESFGATPVTMMATPTGLVLDKSKSAYGPELISDNGFDVPAFWSITGAWAVTGGVGTTTNGIGGESLYRPGTVTVGKWYTMPFDIASISLGGVVAQIGGTQSLVYTTAGTKALILRADFNSNVNLVTSGTTTATVDNISVKEVLGNHLYQDSFVSRPIYNVAGAINYLSFDGVNDSLIASNVTLGADMDCFIAMQINNVPDDDAILTQAGGPNYVLAVGGAGPINSGAGTPTYAVNGTNVASTRAGVQAIATQNTWVVVEIRNANLSTWTSFSVSGWSPYVAGISVAGIVLCPAGDTTQRNNIRTYLGASVGLVL